MELTFQLSSPEDAVMLFGLGDRNLKLLRDALGVQLTARGGVLTIRGEDSAVEQAQELVEGMIAMLDGGLNIPPDHLERELQRLSSDGVPTAAEPVEAFGSAPGFAAGDDPSRHYGNTDRGPADRDGIPAIPEGAPDGVPAIPERGDPDRSIAPSDPSEPPPLPSESMPQSEAVPSVGPSDASFPASAAPPVGATREAAATEGPRVGRLSEAELRAVEGIARTPGQKEYIESILKHDIVFCVGPAGTGKTFLAVRMAVNLLRDGQVKKLILCRPAVEAGEKLGFLPGDFQAKINPYLRPLYDALNEILDYEQVKRHLEREIIEIIPLAYMRGRTLNNAFIILDEGQNTTVSQMKMFLTRMGMRSKIVVNGDTTQVDLPEGQLCGLTHVGRIVRGVEGIGWCEMRGRDIVRHPLVRKLVDAYERADARKRSKG